MGILAKLLGRKRITPNLFDKAPYLSPWYFDEANPKLIKNNENLKWFWIEKFNDKYVGIITLQDKNNNCLAIIKLYTYILPCPENDKFLIWTRSNEKASRFTELKLSLYQVSDLPLINNRDEILLSIEENKAPFSYFNCGPKSSFSLVLNPDEEFQKIDFPLDLKTFPDFHTVCDIPGLYKDGNKEWNNTAIISIKPGTGTISIYPQDWFNKSNADFGYQWITRVVENPRTGLIQGQGIRINDFLLDKTNRQLLR